VQQQHNRRFFWWQESGYFRKIKVNKVTIGRLDAAALKDNAGPLPYHAAKDGLSVTVGQPFARCEGGKLKCGHRDIFEKNGRLSSSAKSFSYYCQV
jgi:hypothetical protein